MLDIKIALYLETMIAHSKLFAVFKLQLVALGTGLEKTDVGQDEDRYR